LAACAPFWLGGAGDDGRTAATHAQGVILTISPRPPACNSEDLTDQPFLAATASVVEASPATPAKPAAPASAARFLAPSIHAAPVSRPRHRTRTIRMLVTAYCPCEKCCGGFNDGVTASGKSIYTNQSHFVAADTRLFDFGTRLSIPGYYGGAPVSVLDRGGKIKGCRLDVFFMSHERATRWGARWIDVTVYLD